MRFRVLVGVRASAPPRTLLTDRPTLACVNFPARHSATLHFMHPTSQKGDVGQTDSASARRRASSTSSTSSTSSLDTARDDLFASASASWSRLEQEEDADAGRVGASSETHIDVASTVDFAQAEREIARLAHEPSLGRYYVAKHAKSRALDFTKHALDARERECRDARRARLAGDFACDAVQAMAKTSLTNAIDEARRCEIALARLVSDDDDGAS